VWHKRYQPPVALLLESFTLKLVTLFRWKLHASTVLPAILIAFAAPSAHAQAQPPAWRNCTSGIRIRLHASSAVQGGLVLVDVRAPRQTKLSGEWDGHPLPLWRDAKDESLQHALAGVDLEHPPGSFDITITATSDGENQKPETCRAAVSIRAGHFAVENLSVDPQFVEPNPEELERAKKEGARMDEIFATVTPERYWRGSFHLPLAAGARNARNFGRRRVLNGEPRSPHSGVDLPAPAGTPIYASQRGRVALAENLYFSGNTVVLDHGLGVYTMYFHMKSIAVHEGDMVTTGAVLGKVGATGRATGPHLHWGLKLDEARVNPLNLVGLPLS
jgi:hypothetical protein